MSKPTLAGALFLFLGLASLVAWADSPRAGATSKKAATEPGRFTVSPAGNSAVLLDSITGKTWVLQIANGPTPGAVWVPLRRFDTEKEVQLWQAAERARKELPPPGTGRTNVPAPMKVPRLESLQYDAARIRAALDALDVQKAELERRQAEMRTERDQLFRQLEGVEQQIKIDKGATKAPPK
jgi:hypothetical protein